MERKENEVQPERENKLKDLSDEIAFYSKYKEDSEREKKKL